MKILYYLFNFFSKMSLPIKILFLMFIFLLDPLGLVSASDEASKSFINRVQAIFYSQDAQKEITVVLIDDEYLKTIQSHWPLPYSQQANLFKRILHYQPNALFIDLLYTHDRSIGKDNAQRVRNIFERYEKNNNTPIYLAKVENEHNQKPKAFNQHPLWASVSWQGFEQKYPFMVDDTHTAGTALYKEYCQTHQECTFNIEGFKSPMILQWGLKLSKIQNSITNNANCESQDSNLSLLLTLSLSDVFWRLKPKFRQACPYTTTIMASHLLANDHEAKALFNKVIRNKIVILGAKIEGARDIIYSPIHGQVAGVYMHAMALDNLISYGENYTREPPSVLKTDINWLELLELLFIVLIMYFRWLTNREQTIAAKNIEQADDNIIKQHIITNLLSISTKYADKVLSIVLIGLLISTLSILLFTNYETINFIGLFLLAISFLPSNKMKKTIDFFELKLKIKNQ